MAESIFDILNDVKEVDTTDPNSRVLIIDGLNLFLRNFSVNGMLNDNGIPIGGVMGFLKSLALSIREVNPTRVVVAFDGKGGSTRRRKILPSYKNNRKPGKRMTRWDFSTSGASTFPIKCNYNPSRINFSYRKC
jgi:5'-3' exonuclease